MPLHDARDLRMDIAPIPHPIEGEEIFSTVLPHFALGLEGVQRPMIPVPDVQQGYEIGVRVLKGHVRLIGRAVFLWDLEDSRQKQ